MDEGRKETFISKYTAGDVFCRLLPPGDPVVKPRWGQDQPNSYVGEQNCVVLDGGRDWLWNDFTCNIDYLHWICEYSE